MFIMNLLKKALSLAALFGSALHMEAVANEIHLPLYHPNGSIAWNGYESSPFYYENHSILWEGMKHPHSLFSYKNGNKAWGGYLYRDYTYDPSLITVYHMNGQKAWGGLSRADSFFEKDISIFHDNGQKAWGGLLADECFLSYTPSVLYHSNGLVAWGGDTLKKEQEHFYTNKKGSYVYHSNGAVAWRGGYVKDGNDAHACAIYYSGGELAWSGRSTDPIYDRAGNITTGRTDSITLDLGNCSTLHVHSTGYMQLFLGLGNSSSLIFTSTNRNPELVIALDYPAYMLIFSPHSPDLATRFIAYGRVFPIK